MSADNAPDAGDRTAFSKKYDPRDPVVRERLAAWCEEYARGMNDAPSVLIEVAAVLRAPQGPHAITGYAREVLEATLRNASAREPTNAELGVGGRYGERIASLESALGLRGAVAVTVTDEMILTASRVLVAHADECNDAGCYAGSPVPCSAMRAALEAVAVPAPQKPETIATREKAARLLEAYREQNPAATALTDVPRTPENLAAVKAFQAALKFAKHVADHADALGIGERA